MADGSAKSGSDIVAQAESPAGPTAETHTESTP